MPTDALSYVPAGSQYDGLRNILKRMKADFPEQYGSLNKSRISGWVTEIDSGTGRDSDQIRDDIVEHVIGKDAAQDAYGITSEQWERLILGANEGGIDFTNLTAKPPEARVPTKEGPQPGEDKAGAGVGTDLTILTGKEMAWFYDKSSGKWYVAYGLPNTNRRLLFEADPDQMDALFGKGMRPTNFQRVNFATLTAEERTIFAGNISEMEGTGSLEDEYDKVIALAMDNGDLPTWMKGSSKALDFLFIAHTQNKSNDWLFEQFAKLPEFKARFPGIDKLKNTGNLSLEEAVTGFLEFEAGLKQALLAFGRHPGKITPDIVSGLMGQGWNLKSSVEAMQTLERMKEFGPAMAAFNQILAANGMAPITTVNSFYEFMTGQAPKEFYDLYEASSIQEAATMAGLGDIFDAQDAIKAAAAGDFDLNNATQAMQQAAQLLLRMRGEIDLGKYDLNNDDLIDASLGLAPSSGLSEAELFDRVNRATLSARSNLLARTKSFKGFTDEGKLQNQSLAALRSNS